MKDLITAIKTSFRDKEYRHGYVDDFLNASIATQIKVLREQRGWSQKDLADNAGMLQPRISVLENINYSSWSIKILRKIAEAFDLTLCVSFESFGKRARDIERFSRKDLERTSFINDPYFQEHEATRVSQTSEILKAPEQKEIRIVYDNAEVSQEIAKTPVLAYEVQIDNQQHIAYGG
jgi:transcriptional regulator with XRE-family HTH domain